MFLGTHGAGSTQEHPAQHLQGLIRRGLFERLAIVGIELPQPRRARRPGQSDEHRPDRLRIRAAARPGLYALCMLSEHVLEKSAKVTKRRKAHGLKTRRLHERLAVIGENPGFPPVLEVVVGDGFEPSKA